VSLSFSFFLSLIALSAALLLHLSRRNADDESYYFHPPQAVDLVSTRADADAAAQRGLKGRVLQRKLVQA
jgi:hypothetical protein